VHLEVGFLLFESELEPLGEGLFVALADCRIRLFFSKHGG